MTLKELNILISILKEKQYDLKNMLLSEALELEVWR